MEHLVFVYGSLKRGLLHHDQLRGAVFLAAARLEGYAMVLYEDSYPALFVDSEADSGVEGEVFSVTSELLASLDRFEEVPELYQRVSVTLPGERRAFAYVIDPNLALKYPRLQGPWVGRRRDE